LLGRGLGHLVALLLTANEEKWFCERV
jgi:hypothetical protein